MDLKFIFVSALLTVVLSEVRYDNHALFRVLPQNEDHLEFLKDLYEDPEGLNFWLPPTKLGEYVSVVAPPDVRKEFEHSLKKRSIEAELMLENIQEAFDAQLYSRRKRDTSRQLHWDGFQTLEDINAWFEDLAAKHSDFVSIISAGQSFEGRNITGLKISRRSGNRAFVLQGGEIGADWISPVVITYIVDHLVKGEDPEALAATEEFEWHIFPIINPDGYEYTQIGDRLWIKNRRPISGSNVGVDISRNWNSQWGIIGGSYTASSDNYLGLGPFSEVESRRFSYYIESIGSNLAGLLSFKSFGQRFLIPFAHSREPMYNYDKMLAVGRKAMGALSVKYETVYRAGTSINIFDGSTGNIADWAKYRFNPPVVATYLLRDEGQWGYTLPVNQVLPTCEETYESFLAVLREAKYENVL